MTRVLLFATHPYSSNGYSKIAFELAKQLSVKPDIELTYYGFQNFNRNEQHNESRKLPSNVQVYDAFANEKNKQMGFGFEEVTDFVTLNKPDAKKCASCDQAKVDENLANNDNGKRIFKSSII